MDIGKQKGYKRPMTLKKTIEQHKYTILFCLILVFGSILRLAQLGKVPGGYQMDEAYGAFNAYSLFHSGIDSTGHSYPVYFESWGGGQNALNSYLMLPFMVFTGGKITPLVVRLPQAIVAILSLVAVSFLMKEMVNEAAGLWAMLLLSVCPWHIMMSRWGLESNLAPGFLLFGLTFFVYGLKKPRLLILSALSYGLSLYCYATNCIYIPLVLCGALCVSSLTDFLGKKVNFYGKIVVSILLAALLLGENVQFEKAYFTSYKELVSAYFQEGSEEAVQKAMEIAAESGREIEIEDAIKYPSVLLYGEIDAAEYLANRNLSDAPPKPESFLGKGIRFTMGIDWEHIDRNKIYIIYYTDAEKFDGFTLLPCRDWYVAY